MRNHPALAAALVAAGVALGAHSSAPAARVVQVEVPTPAARDLVLALGLDVTEHAAPGRIDVVLHDGADAARLERAGLEFRALAPATSSRAAPALPLPSGRVAYRRLADYGADLRRLAADHPSTVATLTAPVASIEGRPIEGVEVTDRVRARDGKPVLLVLGLHHAREWPSGELSLEFAIDLARRHAAGDAGVRALLRRARVVVVPVVNPDGFHVSRESEGGSFALKRRNCRLAGLAGPATGACGREEHRHDGVDLNRNYDGFFGGPGSSADPRSDTYRGPAPFSEPETEAVRRLVSSRQVVTLVSNHTYGALVLRPPGLHRGPAPADEHLYRRLGDAMAAAAGYTSRRAFELYETTGTTEDWSHFATGGFGYTIEIGPAEGPSPFHPPYASGVAGQWPGMRRALMRALEATADPARHAVIAGRGRPGATLRVRTTAGEPVASAMTVPPDGVFALHVNPSTRPQAAAAGRSEAWTLTCRAPDGARSGPREVVVRRGDRVHVGDACEAAAALSVDVRIAGPRTVRALRSSRGLPVRVRCSRRCSAAARVERSGRTLARAGRRRGGILRLRAVRRARPGRARLRVTARAAGERVVVRRRLYLR